MTISLIKEDSKSSLKSGDIITIPALGTKINCLIISKPNDKKSLLNIETLEVLEENSVIVEEFKKGRYSVLGQVREIIYK